ncbi:MAG: hypothetical protein K6U74_08605 [Firmicutes bacterium]|nr:hypothetical protein [Bacillota bacterium]
MDEAIIKAKVDEYVKWDKLISAAKKEIEKLKADFQKIGLDEMKDRKIKQVEFWGSRNSKVVVTVSESLKLVSYNYLLEIMGATLLGDLVKVETDYKPKEPFKRLLTAIFQGNYSEHPVDEIIDQITEDEKTRKALRKKLKGQWDKDVESLKAIAGLNQSDAEHYAWFIHEAKNYQKIVRLLEAAGHGREGNAIDETLEKLRHAVIVEESVKVGLEKEGAA